MILSGNVPKLSLRLSHQSCPTILALLSCKVPTGTHSSYLRLIILSGNQLPGGQDPCDGPEAAKDDFEGDVEALNEPLAPSCPSLQFLLAICNDEIKSQDVSNAAIGFSGVCHYSQGCHEEPYLLQLLLLSQGCHEELCIPQPQSQLRETFYLWVLLAHHFVCGSRLCVLKARLSI